MTEGSIPDLMAGLEASLQKAKRRLERKGLGDYLAIVAVWLIFAALLVGGCAVLASQPPTSHSNDYPADCAPGPGEYGPCD